MIFSTSELIHHLSYILNLKLINSSTNSIPCTGFSIYLSIPLPLPFWFIVLSVSYPHVPYLFLVTMRNGWDQWYRNFWSSMFLFPTPRKQRQVYFHELEGSIVYMVSCRIASTMYKEALSKQEKRKKREERKEGKKLWKTLHIWNYWG